MLTWWLSPMPDRQLSTGNGTRMVPLSATPIGANSPSYPGWNCQNPALTRQWSHHTYSFSTMAHSSTAGRTVEVLPTKRADQLRTGVLRQHVVLQCEQVSSPDAQPRTRFMTSHHIHHITSHHITSHHITHNIQCGAPLRDLTAACH